MGPGATGRATQGKIMLKSILLLTAGWLLTMTWACGSDNNGGRSPDGSPDPTDYCDPVSTIWYGAEYYQDKTNCAANDYPDNLALDTALKNYKDDQSFDDTVCAAYPSAGRSYCTAGPTSLEAEMNGFYGIVTAPTGASRTQACNLMGPETAGQLKNVLMPYACFRVTKCLKDDTCKQLCFSAACPWGTVSSGCTEDCQSIHCCTQGP